MIYAGVASVFGLGLEDGHVPTVWLVLHAHTKGPARATSISKNQ